MHLICGHVGNRAAGEKDVPIWYTTGISEIKQLLKRAPSAFQEDYQFIHDAVRVAEKITSNTTNEFEKSISSHIYLFC